SDFDREDTRQMLAEELARDPAFRIDLFTRDPARAASVLRESAKAAGLAVFADATTIDRLGKRQGSWVVVYTDALTPEELAAFFGRLCADDAKISPRVFEALHAVPVTQADQRELKSILGTDPGLYKRALIEKPEKSERPGANGKSISAGTADEIVKSVTSGQPAGQGKPPEKHRVLLTWEPMASRTMPSGSAELKQFLAKRGDRKANAVPVIIVIRPGNG